MALHRGIQSAIFYYLSCAPCAEARYRKKRKEEAVRGRADRDALEAEMPNLYRHPSPSSTNPYWGSEIAAGPVLSARGGRRKGYTQNNDSQRRLKSANTQNSDGSNVPSSLDFAGRASKSRDGHNDFAWVMTPSAERLPSPSTTFSASTYDGDAGVTRPARALTKGSDPAASYTSFSNPHVNDLVPAIATQVNSREEAQSIMQGPPTSEYMSGRDGSAGRSRSDSGVSSRLSARSAAVGLSREVSRRTIERKLQNGEALPRQSTSRGGGNEFAGQRHDRGTTDFKDFAQLNGAPHGEGPRRSPQNRAHPSEDSNLSAVTVLHDPSLAPEPFRQPSARRVASRPQLSTIVSSDHISPADDPSVYLSTHFPPNENGHPTTRTHSDTSLAERDRTQRRAPLADPDESLRILHGQKPGGADPGLNGGHVFTSRVPVKDPRAFNAGVDVSDDGGQALFDHTWYSPDLDLPEWVHEHTKREVTQRWSMDL